jgi:hypothetical protein
MRNERVFWVKALIVVGIFCAVNTVWAILEILECGRTMPSVSDTVMGVCMTYALYKNLRVKAEV